MSSRDIEERVNKRIKKVRKEMGDRPIKGATRKGFWSRIGLVDGVGLFLFVIGFAILFLSLIWEISGTLGELAIITSFWGGTTSIIGLLISINKWSHDRQEHIAVQNGYILEENFRQSIILQQQTQILTDIREALKK